MWIPELEANMDIHFYIMTNETDEYLIFPQNISRCCLPEALVDCETVDAFKHGWKNLNSPPQWHWPHQHLYSNRNFC